MKPLIILYTGNGKGKTTAALGGVFRAMGHGADCAVLQFIKAGPENLGEYRTAGKLGILWENYGKGFLWNQETLEPTREEVLCGFRRAQELAGSGKYDMIVLDEFTYTLSMGLLPSEDVVSWLRNLKEKEEGPVIIITGRDAPVELVGLADTVTSMEEIKHHFNSVKKTIPLVEF